MEFLSHTARATVPAALRDAVTQTAVQLATGHAIATVASARVAAWIGRLPRAVAQSYWKTAAELLLLIGALGTGLGWVMGRDQLSPQQPQVERTPPPAAREAILRE